MRFLMYAGAFSLFLGFWLVSTPVYFLTALLEWVDSRLSRLLDDLWRDL